MKCAKKQDLPSDASVYLIVAKDAFLRDEAEKDLVHKLGRDLMAVRVFDASKVSVDAVIGDLDSLSFLSEKRLVVVRHLDELAANDTKKLEPFLSKGHTDVTLILVTASINRATTLYKAIDRVGAILDIPEEKPWEKRKTLQTWLINLAETEGCPIAPEAAQLMVDQLGVDQGTLNQELKKLTLYCAERGRINLKDVETVCAVVNTETIFQLSDALVQRDAKTALKVGLGLLNDGVSFYQLIRQIRSQFQTKFQVCSLLAGGGNPVDVAAHFPYMKGRILDQNCRYAHSYGMERFCRAIIEIDAAEALAKSITSDEHLLTERLIARLTQ